MITTPQQLDALAADLCSTKKAATKIQILVSMGTCGIAAGTTPVLEALKQELSSQGIEGVQIVETGCMGLCHSEPSIEVIAMETGDSIIYGNVKAENAAAIVSAGMTPAEGLKVVSRNWYYPEKETAKAGQLQARIVLRNSGRINPESIEEYIANDGYKALAQTLTSKSPQDIIDIITESGLRGRGGGGFPTGRKWAIAAGQDADEKYIICNADEGDPGAFMDRAVLEGDPHAILEAMAIAGYAIGAGEGIIYIRAEYPLAVKRLQIAIEQAKEKGLLGKNIFGSGFSFELRIKYGAGAFVCGEETALIRSIAGLRGMPTFKPPFPAIEGLWRKPTIVNNVETFANIPTIIREGAGWFKQVGTKGSPGTKVFALAGKINKVGLIEVPMGMTLRQIIFELGEGINGGKEFKAVQTGGPSGGCITTENLDTPIDYDTLKALGSMMGSGGMIVMDEDDCMVDIAKFFLEFTTDESCGKCTPCRVGGRQMYGLLDKITQGNGTGGDLETIRDLAEAMRTASLCGLGMTAPNPVLATLANFEDEYKSHVFDLKCPAGKCSKLVTYTVDEDICTGCTLCARKCPVSCISGRPKEAHVIDQDACIHCGACYDACKFSAILKN
jgi:NADH:ubiquinone oxidoreductase subunit F (NADH-binding)/(2Fe-2S) ferredoxin/Pyruvate/2-oxoacid:ferredoxin oxidoreductase delta subunit